MYRGAVNDGAVQNSLQAAGLGFYSWPYECSKFRCAVELQRLSGFTAVIFFYSSKTFSTFLLTKKLDLRLLHIKPGWLVISPRRSFWEPFVNHMFWQKGAALTESKAEHPSSEGPLLISSSSTNTTYSNSSTISSSDWTLRWTGVCRSLCVVVVSPVLQMHCHLLVKFRSYWLSHPKECGLLWTPFDLRE